MRDKPILVLHIEDARDPHELIKAQPAKFSGDIVIRRVDSRRSAIG